MKAKEVQQKLDNIDKRLSELGDLNKLVQQSQGLPKLFNETEAKKTDVESFLKDLTSSKEELTRLTKNSRWLKFKAKQ